MPLYFILTSENILDKGQLILYFSLEDWEKYKIIKPY